MGKALERRIKCLETTARRGTGPTLTCARAEVVQRWNPSIFGVPSAPSIDVFARSFQREFEGNRANGCDVNTALQGARAGIEVWMRMSPIELRARCELLLERARARRASVSPV
jgi:hypothetical protein